MFQQLKILLFLSLLLLSYQQQQSSQQTQCIYGQNCPYGKGTCIAADFCKCNEGFYTFHDKTLPPGQPEIFCNYEQISFFQPLILEFVLLGHFSVGHYWLGAFKVLLFITYFSLQYYLYNNFQVPDLFIRLFEIFIKIATNELARGGKSTLENILEIIRFWVGNILSVWYSFNKSLSLIRL